RVVRRHHVAGGDDEVRLVGPTPAVRGAAAQIRIADELQVQVLLEVAGAVLLAAPLRVQHDLAPAAGGQQQIDGAGDLHAAVQERRAAAAFGLDAYHVGGTQVLEQPQQRPLEGRDHLLV